MPDNTSNAGSPGGTDDLPEDVVAEAVRLTRLARRAIDPHEAAAYRADRDDQVAAHGYVARVREDDDTLVLYPAEWVDDGTANLDRIDDTERAVERRLAGTGDDDDWGTVESHNADLVEAVERTHGTVHAANARAFADFMGNHYARRVETATQEEVQEFLFEYYPRNAWPTEAQQEVVEQSLRLVFDVAEEPAPL